MDDVDLALVLAFDCSASVTYEEFGLMAGGCAAALRDGEIIAGLTGGPSAASLAALLLWSGAGAQEVMVEWTTLHDAASVAAFADAVVRLLESPRLREEIGANGRRLARTRFDWRRCSTELGQIYDELLFAKGKK